MRQLLALLATLFVLSGAWISAQQQPRLPSGISQSGSQNSDIGDVPVTSRQNDAQRKQQQAANLQRQAEIKRDTEKMLQLTQELNDFMQKSSQNVLSLDAIKKAEQIEKLAHNVKSKMKQVY